MSLIGANVLPASSAAASCSTHVRKTALVMAMSAPSSLLASSMTVQVMLSSNSCKEYLADEEAARYF